MNIVWKKSDGAVAVTRLAGGIDPKKEAKKLKDREDIPSDWKVVATDIALPETREWREAWTWKTSKPVIDIDMEKARAIHLNRIRLQRDEKLKELDVEVMKNITSPKKIEKIEKEKQRLRYLPAALKTQLNKCRTVKDLKLTKVEI